MRFLSKAILVLESNLLRIYVEAGVDLGCAAPSFCLCVCSICVCLGFGCVKKCLWLCLGICDCVCAYVYQCHRCQLNICFWVYVNFCSCVGCCVYVCVFMRLCIYICVCVCALDQQLHLLPVCASVLPLFLLLQSAGATNCSYNKLKSDECEQNFKRI